MNYASKLFRGSTDHWQTTKIKQQLYWVLIVTAGLFVAVRGWHMIGSYIRGEAAPAEQSATVAVDQSGAEQATQASTQDTAPAVTAAPSAPDDAKRDDTAAAATLPQRADEAEPPQVADEAPQTATTDPSAPAAVVVTEREIVRAIFSPSDRTSGALQSPADEQSTSNAVATSEPASPAGQAALARRFFAALAAGDGENDSAVRTEDRQTPATSDSAPPVETGRDVVIVEEAASDEAPPAATAARAREALVFLFGGPESADETSAVERGRDVNSQPANWIDVLVGRPHETAEAVVESSPATNDELESAIPTAETPAANQEGGQAPADQTPPAKTPPAQDESTEAAIDAVPVADDAAASPQEPGAQSGEELVLVNPPDSGGEVRYLLNGYSFMMPPGHSQRLPADRDWRVQFNRGATFGDAELVLRSGNYEFRADDGGWNLKAVEGEGAAER